MNTGEKCQYELIRDEIIRERNELWEVRNAVEDIKKYKQDTGFKRDPVKEVSRLKPLNPKKQVLVAFILSEKVETMIL